MLTIDPSGWWGILLDGVVGAVIGSVVSIGIALLVVQRQIGHERELGRVERRYQSAMALLSAAHECMREVDPLIQKIQIAEVTYSDVDPLASRALFMTALARPLNANVQTAMLELTTMVETTANDFARRDGHDSRRQLGMLIVVSDRLRTLTRVIREQLADDAGIEVPRGGALSGTP